MSAGLSNSNLGMLGSMLRFAQLHKIQQLALIVCAQMLSVQQILGMLPEIPWYEFFVFLDTDIDGRLRPGELATGLQQHTGCCTTCALEHLDMLAQELDVDASGYIEWIEWVAVALLSVNSSMLSPELLSTAFRVLDRPSGDGVIDVADIQAVVDDRNSGLSLEQLLATSKMLAAADVLGLLHMSLTYEDFKQLILSAVSALPDADLSVEVQLSRFISSALDAYRVEQFAEQAQPTKMGIASPGGL